VIDEAQAVIEAPDADIVDASEIAPSLEQIHGAVKRSDGLVLIHDLEKFLSLDEEQALDQSMKEEIPHGA
jgi:purine-binding chemotaxis protein CheW